MSLTSIIIPNFNGEQLLRGCIASIRQFTSVPYEIIIVDNGSTDGSLGICKQEKVNFISLPDNRGFPAACNLGLRMASGSELMLLNNDTVVTYGWLEHMQNCLRHDPAVGLVGPLTNYASGKQKTEQPYETVEQLHAVSRQLFPPDPSKWMPVNRLIGFCLLFTRELYEGIGGLDERFSPGHYEDDDFCYRIRMAGHKLMIAGDSYVHHYGGSSFLQGDAGGLQALIDRNYRLFTEKWGINPHQYI